jgi:phosphoribosylformylglycinamidine synthase
MHAVAEAARKVACTGATPVAATNCLNFGNPEKPEIMAQLSAAIDGIAEACTALGTPITGGNVSLYNETRGEGIYPTPVVGVVGILDDVTKAVPAEFQQEGDAILFLSGRSAEIIDADGSPRIDDMRRFGSSEFARVLLNSFWGLPPQLNLDAELRLHKTLAELSAAELLSSASDLSDGGLGAALAKACIEGRIGAVVQLGKVPNPPVPASPWELLFAEPSSAAIVSCDPTCLAELYKIAQRRGLYILEIGSVRGNSLDVSVDTIGVLAIAVAELRAVWSTSLESHLTEEVTA